jgi:prepilin-type N-terminal cleavage/methylation domain-containing protein
MSTRQQGFTLIELVVVISISMVVVGFAVMFLQTPVDIYFAQARRADLINEATLVASNMSSDLRAALPGTVRWTRNGTVEVLEINSAPPAGPIAYLCDSDAQTMRRYSNYVPDANLANRNSHMALVAAGAQVGLLAQDVFACQITYIATNPLRASLVGLQLQLSRVWSGNAETMMVFRQMPIGS